MLLGPAFAKPAFSGPVEFCGTIVAVLKVPITVVGGVSAGVHIVIVTTSLEVSLVASLLSSAERSHLVTLALVFQAD